MEKVCPKCHKVHENMSDKFCSNCGTKLKAREKRKPIPPELRHKILVRDGYRCRECGKSRDETSLEIDHIHPLSKGGPTTEDNLWVLCRECNQAKKDDVWKDDEIEVARNELSNLENQLQEAEKELQITTDEDEIRDYKYKIKKFKTEYIPNVTNKLNKLIREENDLEIKRKKQQGENIRRERLFKDLYIELDGELLLEVCDYYSLTEKSNEDNLRILVDMHSENEIYERIDMIKKELKEEADRKELYDKLYNTLSDDELKLFITEFSMQGSKEDILNELVNLFSEDDIELLRMKLIEKEKERLKAEKLALHNRISSTFDDNIILLFANEFSLDNSKDEVIDYLIDNYPKEEIYSMRTELIKKERLRQETIRKEFYNNVNSMLNDHDITLFAKEKNLSDSKSKVVNFLIDNYTLEEIKQQLSELHIKESKEILYEKLMKSLDRLDFIMLHKSNQSIRKYETREEIVNYLVESYSENEINDILKTNRENFNQKKNDSRSFLNKKVNEGLALNIGEHYGFSLTLGKQYIIKKDNKQYVINTLVNNFTYDEIQFMVDETYKQIKMNRSAIKGTGLSHNVKGHLIKVDPLFMEFYVNDLLSNVL